MHPSPLRGKANGGEKRQQKGLPLTISGQEPSSENPNSGEQNITKELVSKNSTEVISASTDHKELEFSDNYSSFDMDISRSESVPPVNELVDIISSDSLDNFEDQNNPNVKSQNSVLKKSKSHHDLSKEHRTRYRSRSKSSNRRLSPSRSKSRCASSNRIRIPRRSESSHNSESSHGRRKPLRYRSRSKSSCRRRKLLRSRSSPESSNRTWKLRRSRSNSESSDRKEKLLRSRSRCKSSCRRRALLQSRSSPESSNRRWKPRRSRSNSESSNSKRLRSKSRCKSSKRSRNPVRSRSRSRSISPKRRRRRVRSRSRSESSNKIQKHLETNRKCKSGRSRSISRPRHQRFSPEDIQSTKLKKLGSVRSSSNSSNGGHPRTRTCSRTRITIDEVRPREEEGKTIGSASLLPRPLSNEEAKARKLMQEILDMINNKKPSLCERKSEENLKNTNCVKVIPPLQRDIEEVTTKSTTTKNLVPLSTTLAPISVVPSVSLRQLRLQSLPFDDPVHKNFRISFPDYLTVVNKCVVESPLSRDQFKKKIEVVHRCGAALQAMSPKKWFRLRLRQIPSAKQKHNSPMYRSIGVYKYTTPLKETRPEPFSTALYKIFRMIGLFDDNCDVGKMIESVAEAISSGAVIDKSIAIRMFQISLLGSKLNARKKVTVGTQCLEED